jgi:ribosome-binding protein aMBF1 (putative translation factor)
MIGAYEITDPRTRPCEFCDQEVAGRVMVELYGGSLLVCQHCYELLTASRSRPYSRAMDKFSMRACGYHASAKMARIYQRR